MAGAAETRKDERLRTGTGFFDRRRRIVNGSLHNIAYGNTMAVFAAYDAGVIGTSINLDDHPSRREDEDYRYSLLSPSSRKRKTLRNL